MFPIVILIVFVIAYIVISTKIGNLRYRAKQHILKDTGLSSSDIESDISNKHEKKHMEKFLEENPTFTEESIKEVFKRYSVQLINGSSINEFSQKVYEKMQNDNKLAKMRTMEFKRAYVIYYGNSKINAEVVYSDNRDEHIIVLNCSILGNRIQLDYYGIRKGAVVGF